MTRYDAVLFDLLTALLDSWSLWNAAAGNATAGLRWRQRYLQLTYGATGYAPYEALVAQSARDAGLTDHAAAVLVQQWDTIAPWPETPGVLQRLAQRVPVGVVTNCSQELGMRAVARLGTPVRVAITAEQAGHYKPHPAPYQLAVEALGVPVSRVLYVAGSPFDLPGASAVGLDVIWHNRIGLSPLPQGPAPLAELRTLDDLPAWVGA